MRFTAAGDALIQQRIPETYEGFETVRDFISQGDARFFNLETTLNYEGECFASQFSGGTYVRTDPEAFGDMLRYGFNMTSFNNNHTMDFSYEGLIRTLDTIREYDVPSSGVGRNLSEASAPHYLDTPNGRAAIISVCTSFDPSMMAGEQARRVPGRPGINGLRHNRTVILPKEDFEFICRIGESSGINISHNRSIQQGYAAPNDPGVYMLDKIRFQEGPEAKTVTSVNEEDMARVEKAVFEASLQADYILISVHSHQNYGNIEDPPAFLQDFAHRSIDAGAHAVIGHGPHLLRPIEVYRDRPIFYSLGDFILQLYSVALAPEDFYVKQGLTSDASVHELLAKRSKNFTRGLMEDRVMRETVVPYWEMENGKLKELTLLPIELSMNENRSKRGLPVVTETPAFFERLREMSRPYGTKMELKDGLIRVSW
ncbi:MAG: CapA family protein [Lachnospiraceae bacterium]|nr:CapA family protein [Lachnospiraceae bacterium]